MNEQRTSISAIIALVCALLTVPGVFCCAGYGTGLLSVVLGIIAVVQHRNGEANVASAIMGGSSIAISVIAMGLYLIIFGATFATSMADLPAP